MAKTFKSFDETVRDICNAADDPSAKKYLQVARLLKNKLEGLNLLVLPVGVKTKFATVQSNLTVNMPKDAAVVSKAAVMRNGIPFMLRPSEALHDSLIPADCTCGEEVPETVEQIIPCNVHTFCGDTGEMFGYYTRIAAGTYRPDYVGGVIELSGVSIGERIAVGYRSVEKSLNLIPVVAYNMIEALVLSSYFASKNISLSRHWSQIFDSELSYYKESMSPWDWDEIIESVYGSARAAKQ